MTYDRQNRILSANKISQRKSVMCHAKIGRFCRPIKSFNIEHVLFLTMKWPTIYRFCLRRGLHCHSACLQWEIISILVYKLVIYSVNYPIIINNYFRSLDAEKSTGNRYDFCDLLLCIHETDIIRSCE